MYGLVTCGKPSSAVLTQMRSDPLVKVMPASPMCALKGNTDGPVLVAHRSGKTRYAQGLATVHVSRTAQR